MTTATFIIDWSDHMKVSSYEKSNKIRSITSVIDFYCLKLP